MQHQHSAGPRTKDTDSSSLLRAIPGMAATMRVELTELKVALQKIIQGLPHATAATAASFCYCSGHTTTVLSLRPKPQSLLPEVYYGEPETIHSFPTILSLYFCRILLMIRKTLRLFSLVWAAELCRGRGHMGKTGSEIPQLQAFCFCPQAGSSGSGTTR